MYDEYKLLYKFNIKITSEKYLCTSNYMEDLAKDLHCDILNTIIRCIV